jgi:hypothetical protein
MTFIVDGTNGLTFNNSTTQASAGVVLQVVNATYSTQVTTTSATFVTTNLTASITPKFSTSKILIQSTCPIFIDTGGNGVGLSLYKGGSLIFNPSAVNTGTAGYVYMYGASATLVPATLQYLDSPATTSSTTYTIYFCRYGAAGTAYVNYGTTTGTSVITLMEIAG